LLHHAERRRFFVTVACLLEAPLQHDRAGIRLRGDETAWWRWSSWQFGR
jgi:hypothetical protein